MQKPIRCCARDRSGNPPAGGGGLQRIARPGAPKFSEETKWLLVSEGEKFFGQCQQLAVSEFRDALKLQVSAPESMQLQ